MEQLSLGVASMVLTIVKESEAPLKARMLIGRANQEVSSSLVRQDIIDMISTIMVYKFNTLSREEIDAMLGTKLEETRVFQEAQEDKAKAIAFNMLRKGMSPEAIAEMTGLTIEQLHKLQADSH